MILEQRRWVEDEAEIGTRGVGGEGGAEGFA